MVDGIEAAGRKGTSGVGGDSGGSGSRGGGGVGGGRAPVASSVEERMPPPQKRL